MGLGKVHHATRRAIGVATDETWNPAQVAKSQSELHDADHDYEKSPPHARHPQLRHRIEDDLTAMVSDVIARKGSCRALEIGAGHGTFTQTLVDAGAEVTVTEASVTSADYLRTRFVRDPRVTVLFDETGEGSLELPNGFDLTACVSVLHHIPDYLSFVTALVQKLAPGGAFYSVQDPMYYPRVGRLTHGVHHGTYLLWRLGQGNYGRGLKTRVRRLRGVYDDSPSDLVEYHVVRHGVDEEALFDLLAPRFAHSEVFTYWSTQSPILQRLGERSGMRTTFGIRAVGYRGPV